MIFVPLKTVALVEIRPELFLESWKPGKLLFFIPGLNNRDIISVGTNDNAQSAAGRKEAFVFMIKSVTVPFKLFTI